MICKLNYAQWYLYKSDLYERFRKDKKAEKYDGKALDKLEDFDDLAEYYEGKGYITEEEADLFLLLSGEIATMI